MRFNIRGMCCAEEEAALTREVGDLVGKENLSFNLLRGEMTVLPTAGDVSAESVQRAVWKTGMRAEIQTDGVAETAESFWDRWGTAAVTVISGLFAAIGFLLHAGMSGNFAAALGAEHAAVAAIPWIAKLAYAAGILIGGWAVAPKAWLAVRRLRPDMNLLMTLAVVGAVCIGEWLEAATVAFLFSLSLSLESWSLGKARRAVAALMDLAPPVARVRDGCGCETEVSPESVAVGAVFLVKPGERLPLDGEVTSGTGEVNQAPITGESVPVLKSPGDEVFAGAINGDSALEVRCLKPASESTLARIIHLVAEAQSRRAPSQQWVERFAAAYTPAVLILAAATAMIPPLLLGEMWSEWIYRGLVLMVIGCPCALVISTPVSVVAGLTSAARRGILVKGGAHLETPSRLKAVALDKTGTLTEGKAAVAEVIPLNGHDESELLEIAASIECHSSHPLALAITRRAQERGIEFSPADDFQAIQGKGATADIRGRQFWIGSLRYLEERNVDEESLAKCRELARGGRSAVAVGNAEHVCGLIAVSDQVRPQAKQALKELRKAGVRRIVMLTGDNESAARAIGEAIGIDEIHADLLPEDKVAAVEKLVEEHGCVAMVGDGVNDAPAMARSSLGIAMASGGVDAAIETADAALTSDDLSKLPWLIRHSRKTLSVIRQNIIFALSTKAVFALLAMAGWASLWAAIAADMGASLLVIFNGLRLLRSNSD
ncbi:MAG: heavy metal translocating P-type ATPase [Planctomycetales bacterium]